MHDPTRLETGPAGRVSSSAQRRPNIIIVMTDDQGAWALGAAGNPDIVTPNLDALAADGLLLERFFCASPVCSPARASFLTGLTPSAHGVHDWISDAHVGPGAVDFLQGQRLLTDDLADAGYRCALVGKWHLGANDRPRAGFVHWFAHQRGGSTYYDAPVVRDGELAQETGYITDAFTDDACRFIEAEAARGADEPFLLCVNYTAPHSPWKGNHPDELTSLYDDCAFDSVPQADPHPWARLREDGSHQEGEPDVRAALVGYFAAITGVDRGVGRILDTLRAHDLEENTLVIFTSDNGFSCGQHGFWGKGNGTDPLNTYDSSVLVPFIARHPGRIPPGRRSREMLAAYDVRATLLDYLGVAASSLPHSPGRSFAALLTGAGSARPATERVVIGDEYGRVRMIRTDDWKYVRRFPDGPDELYDLVADPAESRNLVRDPEQRERVDRMAEEMADWFSAHSFTRHDGRALPVSGLGQKRLDHLPDAFVERT